MARRRRRRRVGVGLWWGGGGGWGAVQPGKYIRHIYNRIILENATVRAAAVTALAKFGAAVRVPRGRG